VGWAHPTRLPATISPNAHYELLFYARGADGRLVN